MEEDDYGPSEGFTLKVTAINMGGLQANFYAKKRQIQISTQALVKKGEAALYRDLYVDAPLKTGDVKKWLRKRRSEGGYVFEVGWYYTDFINNARKKGKSPFYLLYYVKGTSRQAARDFITPIQRRHAEDFRLNMRQLVRRRR